MVMSSPVIRRNVEGEKSYLLNFNRGDDELEGVSAECGTVEGASPSETALAYETLSSFSKGRYGFRGRISPDSSLTLRPPQKMS